MSCENIIPATQLTICEFAEKYRLKLTVQEDGKGSWHASFSPPVESHQEWEFGSFWSPVTSSANSPEEAIQALCRTLSGSPWVRIEYPVKRWIFDRVECLMLNLHTTKLVPVKDSDAC